ncbi:MAG: alcohol dehydrogenase catalytic domain-containing protein [Lachnospiraceae bacterium]|nr:alcohol dehydrogenase catalytic domain-containing protein [Lachnospiraceae bacterium]
MTIDLNIYCYKCYYCLKDQKNMCENKEPFGITKNGIFSEYVAVLVFSFMNC